MGSRGIFLMFLALVIAATACESFGDGGTPATPASDAGEDATTSDGSATDGGASVDAGDKCPVGALACHFFDGPLVQSPWETSGNTKGTGLLTVQSQDGRTFGRVATGADPRSNLEDRLRATFEPVTVMEIDLDFRVNEMPPTQSLEVASIVRGLDTTTYHVIHFAFELGRAKLALFAEPLAPAYATSDGWDIGPGWHHANLKADYGVGRATLQIDQAVTFTRNLSSVPPTAGAAEVLLGFVHAENVQGALSVDLDSVVVRGSK